jgi:SAM-dependent methyltransferase
VIETVDDDLSMGFAPNHERALDDVAKARNYNEWIFNRASAFLGRHVVDIGAGIGTFTEMAAEHAETVTAIEPHPEFASLLERRFSRRPNVAVCRIEANALSPEVIKTSVDSVICFNVLEHIEADGDALARFHAVLGSGGHLLLLVPAHQSIYGSLDRAFGHVRRYSKATLRPLLEKAGFAVHQLRYVNPVGAVGWAIAARLLRRTELPPTGLRYYDRLVPLLRLFDRVDLPVGLSLWAVARRR